MPRKKTNIVTITDKMVHFETKSGKKASIFKFAFIEMVKGPLTKSILEEWINDADEEVKHADIRGSR